MRAAWYGAALCSSAVLHLLELALTVQSRNADVPPIFRSMPWIEIPERLGIILLLCVALTVQDDHLHTGHNLLVVTTTYLVTLPSGFGFVRALSDCTVRRRVYGEQSSGCLAATTALLCVRATAYAACECIPFALYVLEAYPLYLPVCHFETYYRYLTYVYYRLGARRLTIIRTD